jgi:hypothetical protein
MDGQPPGPSLKPRRSSSPSSHAVPKRVGPQYEGGDGGRSCRGGVERVMGFAVPRGYNGGRRGRSERPADKSRRMMCNSMTRGSVGSLAHAGGVSWSGGKWGYITAYFFLRRGASVLPELIGPFDVEKAGARAPAMSMLAVLRVSCRSRGEGTNPVP